MDKLEEVIKGLEHCAAMSGDECRECPYEHECRDNDLPYGMSHLAADALELLKGKESEWVKMMGMMIPELHGYHECKNCGYHEDYHNREVLYPFCPNCGAKMKNGIKEGKRYK